ADVRALSPLHAVLGAGPRRRRRAAAETERGAMTAEAAFVLRDLPGVAQLEARMARVYSHPYPSFHAEHDGLQDHVASVAKSLFGIDENDIRASDAHGMLYAWSEDWAPMVELLRQA